MSAGRPREFDMEQVLQSALGVFWTKGYADTSMADLMEATGLAKGSLYKAFRDKHDIFMRALSAYLQVHHTEVRTAIESSATPEKGIRAWIEAALSMCQCPGVRRGCFALNTLVELGPHDEEAAGLLKRHAAQMEKLLTSVIERGQKRRQFRQDKPAAQLAEALLAFVAGMISFSKVEGNKARSRRLGEFAIEMLK